MENIEVGLEPMELPPGFRFHPTDEELITHYLSPKVLDVTFSARAIGQVDLNKCEPWDLPKMAKMGEKELYFFCVRDRKYPTGLRTNRATDAGYWKATGKDKEIYSGKSLVGMKKTLVFYKGRAPKGGKSNWVMHEYRLEGKSTIPSNARNEWVICRIFQKSAAGKKIPFQGLITGSDIFGNQFNPSTSLPPLMEASPYNANFGAPHVSCFSNSMEFPQTNHCHNNDQTSYNGSINTNNNNIYNHYSYSTFGGENPYYPLQTGQYSDKNIPKEILHNAAQMKTEVGNYSASQDTGFSSDMNPEISSVLSNYDIGPTTLTGPDGSLTSAGPVDLDSLWKY